MARPEGSLPLRTAPRGTSIPLIDEAKIALYQAMRETRVSKAELGRRLKVHGSQVDRLLKVRHNSHLEQLEHAFGVMGKSMELRIVDQPQRPVSQRRPTAIMEALAKAQRTKRTKARRRSA